ncbi:MAG: STY0301 family protein [Janthinobacterium lividum]
MAVIVCTAAGPANCPPAVTDPAGSHVLDNASVYDGPPNEMADLEPSLSGGVDRWDLDGVDPYLVCAFQGTSRVMSFHVTGARTCEAGSKPFHAGCR